LSGRRRRVSESASGSNILYFYGHVEFATFPGGVGVERHRRDDVVLPPAGRGPGESSTGGSLPMPSRRGPILFGVLCLVSLVLVTQLRVDNRHERMLDQHSRAARDYEEFKKEFGNDNVVIVAVSGKPLFELDSLDTMVAAAERLEKLPYVAAVDGLPVLFRDTFGQDDAEALEKEVTSTPFYQGLFISKDRNVAGLLVELKPMDTPGAIEELVKALDEAVRPLRDLGFRVDLVGDPVFENAINIITMGESLRMFPIAAALSLIALIWLLRSIKATIVVLVGNVVILLMTMASMPATGHTLNLVTASSPLILWVLSLANSIHVVSRFQQLSAAAKSPIHAINETMKELRGSLIMSSITTSLGFLSLITTNVSAIRELGVYMSLGMILMLLVSLYLTPWLCIVCKVPPSHHVHHASRALDRFGGLLTRHPRRALGLFAVFAAVAVFFALKVKAQPDSLAFLPKDHPIVNSYQFVSDHLTGLQSMEVVIETPGGWTNTDYWPAIGKVVGAIEAEPVVSRVFGPFDLLKKVNQWEHDFDPKFYVLPGSRKEADDLLGLMSKDDSKQVDRFESNDGGRIRFSVLMNSREASAFDEVIHTTERALAALPQPLAGHVTGMASRMHEFEFGLLQNQFRSYASSLVMVFVVILVGMRSFRMTLILLPPNFVPLLCVLMVMGAAHISLDVATVMVASVSLGIAVDETILILSYYRWLRAHGKGNFEAIRGSLADVGPACIVTSAVTCIGFFTLAMSIFVPISNFGLLCGIAMFAAVISNFVLVSSILALAGDEK
jgi:hypothetical protein